MTTLGKALRSAAIVVCAVVLSARLDAQMTVSGRVTANDRPVAGAAVGIPELRIETRTIADGSYNFLIRSAQVRGQTVTMTARHRQYGSASVQVQLTGGSLERNFALGQEERRPPPPLGNPPSDTTRPVGLDSSRRADTTRRDTTRRGVAPRGTIAPKTVAVVVAMPAARVTVDSSALGEVPGPLDLVSALAGRMPGLLVTGASTPGGSALMVFRGARSLSNSIQPLVVVDGIPIDNAGFRTATQQFGLGGFDYGTPLQDISLEDVATVELLDQSRSATLYGSRAANGVILVTTKQGASTPGFSFSHRLRLTTESAGRLPSYQSRYGQGSGGVFEFFDGRGGGINDAVEESWGPILEGQPIVQASLTEARRPDVRAWAPHPSGVRDYFNGGGTIDASVALQGARDQNNIRASLGIRSAQGLTPNATARWLNATFSGIARPTARLTAHGNLQLIGARAEDRPGTGFGEINPAAGFTRIGRQVDIAAMRAKIRDTVDQINWIYTARNNPWFQSVENSNDDHHGHIIGGGELTYGLSTMLTATLRAGTDNYHESRNFQVAPGWKGGYPTALGRGSFSGGGSQRQKNSSAERLVDLSVTTRGIQAMGSAVTGTIGVQARRNSFQTTVALDDSTQGFARVPSSAIDTGTSKVASAFLVGALNRGDFFFVNAGARFEKGSGLDSAQATTVFPSVAVAYDAAKTISGLQGLGSAMLRASWWRSGNEITSRTLANTYSGGGTVTTPIFGATGQASGPERTTGTEVGLDASTSDRRIGVGLSAYSERTTELLVATSGAVEQHGEVSNKGIELQLRTEPYRGADDLHWNVDVSFAKNSNKVESLSDGVNDVALGPPIWGATLNARVGQPLGVIIGTRLMRDAATQALILKNGLPIADATAPAVLGSWQPDWSSAISSRLKFGALELGLLLDVRMGGKLFSATNMWGASAGTLSSTLIGRDTGLVIAGTDSVTRAPNTTNVSAESYFHALAVIHEPWVYDASYAKLRDARVTYVVPLRFVPGYREQTARVSIVGRNLFTWARAPNIDPETALSVSAFQGFEMGQLPTTRSFGLQLTITP